MNGHSKAFWTVLSVVFGLVGAIFWITLASQAGVDRRQDLKIDGHDELFLQYAQLNASLRELIARMDERLLGVERRR